MLKCSACGREMVRVGSHEVGGIEMVIMCPPDDMVIVDGAQWVCPIDHFCDFCNWSDDLDPLEDLMRRLTSHPRRPRA